jgi:hypothetical protein
MVLPNIILYKSNKILATVQMDPLFVVAPHVVVHAMQI